MKTCLWTQSSSPTGSDEIVCDGILLGSDDANRQLVINKVVELSEIKKSKKADADQLQRKKIKINSNNFKFHSSRQKGFFLQAFFDEKDTYNRNIPFVFWTSETDETKATELLKQYSALVGKTLFDDDIQAVSEIGKKKIISIILIIALAACIICVLWEIISHN